VLAAGCDGTTGCYCPQESPPVGDDKRCYGSGCGKPKCNNIKRQNVVCHQGPIVNTPMNHGPMNHGRCQASNKGACVWRFLRGTHKVMNLTPASEYHDNPRTSTHPPTLTVLPTQRGADCVKAMASSVCRLRQRWVNVGSGGDKGHFRGKRGRIIPAHNRHLCFQRAHQHTREVQRAARKQGNPKNATSTQNQKPNSTPKRFGLAISLAGN
jgi:hypothetical protein